MNKNRCDMCYANDPSNILNCGCCLCSNCFEASSIFIEGHRIKCYSCQKDIFLSMTINVNKKNIVDQITKYNPKENNEIIILKLKVNNKNFLF